MEKMIDVIAIGDLCVDLILSDEDVIPEFGQKEKLIEHYSLQMGGSCSNFACQTAKLGLKTELVGNIGGDVFGDLIRGTLAEAGVSLEHIKTDSSLKTGITVSLNKGDDRAMLTYSGTIDSVVRRDITTEMLKRVRHFHIGSYFLMKKIQPHYLEIVKELKEYGATISLDTNWDPEEKWDSGVGEIMPYVDILLLNINEAMAISGEKSGQDAIHNLKELVNIVVIKQGAEGAMAYHQDNIYKAKALKVDVIDTVGAGDTFDGGFIYGFLNNRSIENSLQIACICGSLNTTQPGGTKGQPTLDEALKILEEMKS